MSSPHPSPDDNWHYECPVDSAEAEKVMLYWGQLILHAVDGALTCNEDVRTAFACVSFPELEADRFATEVVARPKED
eukprot:315358-Lingulodinium_polyedra.AAC.1